LTLKASAVMMVMMNRRSSAHNNPDLENVGRELDREVRQRIGLLQADLAQRARVAQGSVSNFLKGRPLASRYRQDILEALTNAVQDATAKKEIPTPELVKIRRTLEKARQVLGAANPEDKRSEKLKSLSLLPSRINELAMALTTDERLNLTKGWDYFNPEHFRAHVVCVAIGVEYRWLAYESPTTEVDWKSYVETVIDTIAHHHRHEMEKRTGRSLTTKDIENTVKKQVKLQIFPREAQQLGQLVPFRITMYGKRACLCSEEPEANSYRRGVDTVILRDFLPVWEALNALYEACRQRVPYERLRDRHDTLRHEFLTRFLASMP
jgi:transcriptional regulator with XRE-family HTH domain